jgi:RimJ/RimL family protein N-acetyltransferase
MERVEHSGESDTSGSVLSAIIDGVWRPTWPLMTERLLLRPLQPDDVEALYSYQSRPDVCRYIPYEPRSRQTIGELIADPTRNRQALDDEGQALLLAAVSRSSHAVVGDLMLRWASRRSRSAEIGYVFSPDHWGNGYATEAARALVMMAFDGLGVHRVFARVDARNEASVRVLQRLGMRQEAHFRENDWFKGEWSDELDYALLENEWRSTIQPPTGLGTV